MKKNRILKIILIFCWLNCGLLSCVGDKDKAIPGAAISGSEELQLLTDCAGRKVMVKKHNKRIVDLTYLDGTRVLVELQAHDLLVGMSDMSKRVFKPAGMVKNFYVLVAKVAPELKEVINVGDHKEPNIETILSLKPDVILIGVEQKEYADTLQKQIAVPVVCVGSNGAFNYEVFEVIGKIVNQEARARELIRFSKKKISLVSAYTSRLPQHKKPRIFFWVRPQIGDPHTNGHYDAFSCAGAINIAASGSVSHEVIYDVTREQIVAWDPDYIFVHSPFLRPVKGWHTIESVKNDKLIKNTRAVKSNHVYPTRGHMQGWDIASETAEVFYLAKLLHPVLFATLDVEKHGNEILRKFYGVDKLYTDMSRNLKLHSWH
jgi:iron complex transport system substrate-binding protein